MTFILGKLFIEVNIREREKESECIRFILKELFTSGKVSQRQ